MNIISSLDIDDINDKDNKNDKNDKYNKIKSRLRDGTSVFLCIGDHQYRTTLGTLRSIKNSFFSTLYESIISELDQNEDKYKIIKCIDRDGTHFRYILNYLREPINAVLPDDKVALQELLKEANYYNLRILASDIAIKLYGGIQYVNKIPEAWIDWMKENHLLKTDSGFIVNKVKENLAVDIELIWKEMYKIQKEFK